jgi:hypothetical protein
MDRLTPLLIPLLIIGGWMYMFNRRNRERGRNAPLRAEIEAQRCFETILYRASVLGTGGFGGTRGYWIPLRGPKRLIVGTDAFMVSAPQGLRALYLPDGNRPLRSLGCRPAWLTVTG